MTDVGEVWSPRASSLIAEGLIEKMSAAEFEPDRYNDDYRERAEAMIEEKVKGREIKTAPPAPPLGGKVVDNGRVKAEPRRDGEQATAAYDRQREKTKIRFLRILETRSYPF